MNELRNPEPPETSGTSRWSGTSGTSRISGTPGTSDRTHGTARPETDHRVSGTEERLASELRMAIARRVDATLGIPAVALRSDLARPLSLAAPLAAESAQTPLWKLQHEAEVSAPAQRAIRNRGKKVGLSLAAITAVLVPVFAITHPTLLATDRSQTRTVEVASADTDRFAVKLMAHDPDYKVSGFFSVPLGAVRQPPHGLHVRNGTVSIDVRLEQAENVGRTTTASKPVTIGSTTGELAEDKTANYITIRWTIDGQPVAGYGTDLGQSEADVLVALGQIRFVENKLVFERGTSKFSAVPLEDDPNFYGVDFRGTKRGDFMSYSVEIRPSYADDYLVNQPTIKRGARTYYLYPASSTIGQASFDFGSARVNVSGPVTQDRLLAFADTITEATPDEWETIVAHNTMNGPTEIPSKNVLVDGPLDEDNPSSAKFEFVVPSDDEQKQKECVTVIFTVKDQNKTSCIAKNSTDQFRLLETATADGVTVVYGVDAPDERDNHVVRVTDAAGDVVAEDVTLDQRNFTGRAFGLALPIDSVAPFTVELFDFDREWYQSSEELPDTYVRPDSKPIATATVHP
jgi:hypothetical protein